MRVTENYGIGITRICSKILRSFTPPTIFLPFPPPDYKQLRPLRCTDDHPRFGVGLFVCLCFFFFFFLLCLGFFFFSPHTGSPTVVHLFPQPGKGPLFAVYWSPAGSVSFPSTSCWSIFSFFFLGSRTFCLFFRRHDNPLSVLTSMEFPTPFVFFCHPLPLPRRNHSWNVSLNGFLNLFLRVVMGMGWNFAPLSFPLLLFCLFFLQVPVASTHAHPQPGHLNGSVSGGFRPTFAPSQRCSIPPLTTPTVEGTLLQNACFSSGPSFPACLHPPFYSPAIFQNSLLYLPIC